jgi:hypothetical protein
MKSDTLSGFHQQLDREGGQEEFLQM